MNKYIIEEEALIEFMKNDRKLFYLLFFCGIKLDDYYSRDDFCEYIEKMIKLNLNEKYEKYEIKR